MRAKFMNKDGIAIFGEIPLQPDGTYPAVVEDHDGHEWVLARRPGVIENVMTLGSEGQVGPASDMAWYVQSVGVDATCIECEARIRVDGSEEADDLLTPCRAQGHDVMLLYVHLADEQVIPHISRTVGDVREQCFLFT
jgi:hypothetical protein